MCLSPRLVAFLCLLLCSFHSVGCGDDAQGVPQADAQAQADGGTDATPTLSGSLHGQATRFGETDHGGTVITLEGTGLSTTTSSDGTYALSSVPVGTHTVVATAPGLVPVRRTVEVRANKDATVEKIVLRAGRFVTGDTEAFFVGFVGSPHRIAYLTDFSLTFGTGHLHVWDEETGDVDLGEGVFYEAVVSPDGKALAYLRNLSYLAGLGDLHVYDTETRTSTFVGNTVSFSSIRFTPDSRLLACIKDVEDATGTLIVWDRETQESVTLSNSAWIQSVDVSPDGSRIIFYENVASDSFLRGDLGLWRRADGQVFSVGTNVNLGSVRLAPD